MAGVKFFVQSPEISTGTALKTLLQVTAPTNQRVKVSELSISFKGTSNTAAPIKCDVARQSTAGTMTGLTPTKLDSGVAETIQSTAQHTATSEPTLTANLMTEEVHPQGAFSWQAPFGGELIVAGGSRIGLAVTAAADVTASARMTCEE